MLLVKTVIKPSEIQGLGLFTIEKIKKGQGVWALGPNDTFWTVDQIEKQIPEIKELIYRVGVYNEKSKKWMFCCDEAKYMNHSEAPNLSGSSNLDIALRDIELGEELTINYKEICDDFKNNPKF